MQNVIFSKVGVTIIFLSTRHINFKFEIFEIVIGRSNQVT